MKILIYGNGGREHALAWKLSQSKAIDGLFMTDPNPLMEHLGKAVHVKSFEALAQFSILNEINLVVVGPENPLDEGIVDMLESHGIPTFGPCSDYVWLEASKIRAKEFNFLHSIPCGNSVSIENIDNAVKKISEFVPPYVLKADGLAGGKGVLIAENADIAIAEIESMLSGKFGKASNRVLIEEFLEGDELSAICLYDGSTLLPLEFVRDHKRLLNLNKGPNTGGMGAVSPVELDEYEKKNIFDLLEKISKALKKEKIAYKGVLYVGIMLTKNGAKVLEYNVRFGDPETQALMVRLESDFGEVLTKVMEGKAKDLELKWGEPSNVLVIASKGYPNDPEKGVEIHNFEDVASELDVIVFGGALSRKNGKLVSNGGRILNVVATGKDAHERTLEFAKSLKFDSKIYRTDIGGVV